MVAPRRGVWFGGIAQPIRDLLAVARHGETDGRNGAGVILGILGNVPGRQRCQLGDGQFAKLG